jgi:hypothetical protein
MSVGCSFLLFVCPGEPATAPVHQLDVFLGHQEEGRGLVLVGEKEYWLAVSPCPCNPARHGWMCFLLQSVKEGNSMNDLKISWSEEEGLKGVRSAYCLARKRR